MIDDFITFFVAGQETTANTLGTNYDLNIKILTFNFVKKKGFCFLEIGKNQEVLEKYKFNLI